MAKNQIVSIDIGTNTIKFVQLAQTTSGMRLVNAGVEHYPRMNATEEIDAQTISQTLQRLWAKVQGHKHPVALSIPRLVVTSRRLTNLPSAVTDEQLPNLVAIQAETELPFRGEETIFDYHDVHRTDDGVSVELIAARRKTIQKYIDYLKSVNVMPEAVIPSVLATGALAGIQLSADPSNRTIMVVDIGAGHTDLCLMRGKTHKFSRSFSVGGNQLTLHYQDEAGGDFESAERQKIENATLVRRTPSALPAYEWAERLALELERSIAAAERELNASWTEGEGEIWLCGGGARIPGLADYIADRLQIPTRLWNPLNAFKEVWDEQRSNMESIDGLGDTFAVALGLGVNAFTHQVTLDLLPKEEKAKLTHVEKRQRLITAIAGVGVLLVGLGLGGLTWSKTHQAKVAALDQQIQSLRRAESNAKKVMLKDLAIANLSTPRVSPIDILRELSVRFADRTKVAWTSFDISHLDEPDKTKLIFNIEASSHQDVGEVIRVMGQSGLFTNIKSGQVTSIERDKKPIFQAQVTCNLATDAVQMFAQARYLQTNQSYQSPEEEGVAQGDKESMIGDRQPSEEPSDPSMVKQQHDKEAPSEGGGVQDNEDRISKEKGEFGESDIITQAEDGKGMDRVVEHQLSGEAAIRVEGDSRIQHRALDAAAVERESVETNMGEDR